MTVIAARSAALNVSPHCPGTPAMKGNTLTA